MNDNCKSGGENVFGALDQPNDSWAEFGGCPGTAPLPLPSAHLS